MAVKTLIEASGNAMHRTQKQHQHRLCLAFLDLGITFGSKGTSVPLATMAFAVNKTKNKKTSTLCHPESADERQLCGNLHGYLHISYLQ